MPRAVGYPRASRETYARPGSMFVCASLTGVRIDAKQGDLQLAADGNVGHVSIAHGARGNNLDPSAIHAYWRAKPRQNRTAYISRQGMHNCRHPHHLHLHIPPRPTGASYIAMHSRATRGWAQDGQGERDDERIHMPSGCPVESLGPRDPGQVTPTICHDLASPPATRYSVPLRDHTTPCALLIQRLSPLYPCPMVCQIPWRCSDSSRRSEDSPRLCLSAPDRARQP